MITFQPLDTLRDLNIQRTDGQNTPQNRAQARNQPASDTGKENLQWPNTRWFLQRLHEMLRMGPPFLHAWALWVNIKLGEVSQSQPVLPPGP